MIDESSVEKYTNETTNLCDNYMKNTQTINNQHMDVILSNRASFAHALSPAKIVFGKFLWDLGLMNVTMSRQKIDFVT